MIPDAADTATARLPLTPAQSGLWFAQQIDPANPVFNTGQYVDVAGPLDVPAFAAAVAQAMGEADGLAVRCVDEANGPVVAAGHPVTLEILDCQADADPPATALAAMRRDMERPIDVTADALVAQRLFIVGREHHLWYQRVHHVVIDGYGTALLTNRIADLYRASVTWTAPVTRPFAPFARLAAEQQAYEGSDACRTDRAFWHAVFADAPEVIGLAEGTPLTAHSYRRASASFPAGSDDALAAAADRAKLPWADVLVALAGAYIQRCTAHGSAIVGVPTMLRVGSVAARVPAMVMNVLPVPIADAEAQPFTEFVAGVGAWLRRARRHGRYRSEQLRRDLGRLGEQRRIHGPLVNVLPFDAVPAFPGARTRLDVLGTGPVDDLTMTFRADAEGRNLRLELDANPRLYGQADADDHAARLAAFVGAALSASDLCAVPTATPLEARRYIEDVNATSHPVPDVTLTALLEDQMRQRASAPAVEFEGERLTYGELDRRSAMVARLLAGLGAGPGRFVAVCLPRSLDLPGVLIGVLRAGAAYMPLDTDVPVERLRTLLTTAQPVAAVTTGTLAARFPESVPVIIADGLAWDANERAEPTAPRPAAPGDAAYLIFTSGSTGVPKGVVIEHRAIVNRLEWMRRHYRFDARDRILHKTPVTFDVSVWELFLPFLAGAVQVVAPPEAHRDPAWIARLVRDAQVTTLHFVPSMLAQFLAEPAARGLTCSRVFCSGEALPAALRDRFHTVVDAELHNLYGPTEAAVDVTYWDAGREDHEPVVPIGRPVWNTRMYVLDRRRRPLPHGVAGDLYIAGVQLARGYLGRPDLTAERFIQDPFGAADARMYHTGDVARWRRDGAIEFLGRSDDQVKIRGQRIEPGEIEAALLSTDVAQAVVVAAGAADQRSLVGYLVPRPGRHIDLEAVTARLRERVPRYMVPSAFVVLDELPVNASGKLDRRRLPVPATVGERPGTRRPETSTQRAVAQIFVDVLHLRSDEALGLDSDFFALGGHSLSATEVVRQVRRRWSRDLALGVLFANPSVEALARSIDTAAEAAPTLAASGLGPLLRLASGAAPPLFTIHPAGGIAWCYSGLAHALQPARDVYGVQARTLDPASPLPATLEAMAAGYVESIRQVQMDGPYHLLGWSVGGIIAQAMAVELERQGETVRTLALLDAYPSDRWREQAPPDAEAGWRALLLIAGLDASGGTTSPTRDAVLGALRAAGHPLGDLPVSVLDGVLRVVSHNSRLVRDHRHRRVAAPILHFRAALDHAGTPLSPADWAPYASAVDVRDVAVHHPQMVGAAAVRQITGVLTERWS